ncbi:MAG: AAA family ATPase [Candidatus ainarchaeum sp.]|nr:AAA family ATPase [Candidatus ainarchaeum sp.]
MVKLQKLVLKNFKSFKKAEIPFSDGFTAIVGGNGCGKTNILDALMFVMGATSLKTLRAAKLSELVNNGAMENYAKVDLTIKHNDQKYDISRMIDKQGKSICRLNDQRKTLNEISSLLGELGIRPSGHNIVVQGDATRLIEMTPEERRRIIDELAGLHEFDEKKAEALKNLEKVEMRIKEAAIVMAERENYLQSLERDRQAAMEFGQLQDEKKQVKATALHLEIEKITALRKENTDKVFSVGEEQNSWQAKFSEEDAKIRQWQERSEEINRLILAGSKEAFANFGIKTEEKKAEKMLAVQDSENKKRLLEKNNSRIFYLEEKIKAFLNEQNNREKELAAIEKELPELKRQLDVLRQRKKELEEKGMGKESALKEMDRALVLLAEEESKAQKILFEKKAEISALQREIAFEKLALQETSAELEKAKSEFTRKDEKKHSLDKLMQEHPDIKEELKIVSNEIKKSIVDSKSNESRIIEAKNAINELQKQAASCPVCESRLTIEKKKMLVEKKQDLLNGLNVQSGIFAEQAKKLDAKKARLEGIFEIMRELEFETANLAELKQKFSSLSAKKDRIAKELCADSLEQREREAQKLEALLSSAKAKKMEKEIETREFKAEIGFEKVSSLANSITDIQLRLGLLEQKKSGFQRGKERSSEEKKIVEEEISQLKKANSEMSAAIEKTAESIRLLGNTIVSLQEEMKKSEKESKKLFEEKSGIDEKISASFERKNSLQQKIKRLEQQANEIKIDNSKLEVRLSDLSEEFAQYANVPKISNMEEKQLQKRIIDIEKRIAELGAINMKAVDSFNELKQEVIDVRQKLAKLDEEKLAIMDLMQKIEVKRTTFFMNCFNELNRNFSKMFLELFGGFGQLSLSSPENPLESGLVIESKHKGASMKNIDAMSGGEKTLTALAFLFAIQLYEPSPFYIFDEADAALDKENSAKMVNVIKEMSKKSQFIVVTHNDPLIQNASQIIGVALNKQKSSVVGLKLREQMDSMNAEQAVQ